MTHKTRGVDVEKYAYYVNKLRQNVGLETWMCCQIVTSQTAHTKNKWPPYAAEWTTPMKIFCVRHCHASCLAARHQIRWYKHVLRTSPQHPSRIVHDLSCSVRLETTSQCSSRHSLPWQGQQRSRSTGHLTRMSSLTFPRTVLHGGPSWCWCPKGHRKKDPMMMMMYRQDQCCAITISISQQIWATFDVQLTMLHVFFLQYQSQPISLQQNLFLKQNLFVGKS